jgi:prepilin-type N-terminal cleavage/methylation domain-containing protein
MERDPLLRSNVPRSRSEGGFTLIELLVTLLVTVVALAGLFGVFSVTARGNTDARQASEALALCEASADELKAYTVAQLETVLPYAPIPTGGGWGPMDYHEGDVLAASGATFVRKVYARGIDDDLVWLKLVVEWTSDGAVPGSDGGIHDHAINLEMVRSRTETPFP